MNSIASPQLANNTNRLQISRDPRGWQSVALAPRTVTDRQRAAMALASVRNRRRLGISPAIHIEDIEAVRKLLDVPGAVRLVSDGGDWGAAYGGLPGTLRHLERVRGRFVVQVGSEPWETTGGPLWLLDVVSEGGLS